jgi:hypothetical protein
MTRPSEYENLIRNKAFEVVVPTAGATESFLRNAGDYLATAKELDPSKPLQEVRTKEAGRNLAIQRVSSDLKVDTKEFVFITKAHERRNGTSYHSPFPPVSKAEALTMLAVLEKYLPRAYAYMGLNRPI